MRGVRRREETKGRAAGILPWANKARRVDGLLLLRNLVLDDRLLAHLHPDRCGVVEGGPGARVNRGADDSLGRCPTRRVIARSSFVRAASCVGDLLPVVTRRGRTVGFCSGPSVPQGSCGDKCLPGQLTRVIPASLPAPS